MMKRTKFITILLLLCNAIIAQSREIQIVDILQQYFAFADSMPSYGSPGISVVETESNTYLINSSPFLEISVKDFENIDFIMDWVNDYAQSTKSTNERTLAYYTFHTLIVGVNCKNDKINLDIVTKQKLVSYILNLSSTTNTNVLSLIRYYSDPDYFNDASKDRIRLLLSDSLPQSEMEVIGLRHVDRMKKSSPDTTENRVIIAYEKELRKTEEDTMTMAEWLDRRYSWGFKRYLEGYSTINGSLISLIGNAYLYEFSERLEEIYYDDEYKIYRSNIELVLARLQYKDFEDIVINRIRRELKEENREIFTLQEDLFYIYTTSAILLYAEYLKSDIKVSCGYTEDRTINGKYAYRVFNMLSGLIVDFPYVELIEKAKKNKAFGPFDGILTSFCDIIEFVPESILIETYDWIQENKETLALNTEFSRTR